MKVTAVGRGMAFKVDPMKIDLILTTIFDFCPVSTLKNCRLVSKKWRDLSLKSWRKKAVLTLGKRGNTTISLGTNQNENDDDQDHEEGGCISVQQYLNLLKPSEVDNSDADALHLQLGRYPYRNFIFQSGSQFIELLKDDEDNAALQPISSIARYVKVRNFQSGFSFSIFEEFLAKFNSLPVLELESCHISTSSSDPWLEITRHNNLKRLKISNWIGRRNCEYLLAPFHSLESLCIVHTCSDSLEFTVLQILEKVSTEELSLRHLKELEINYMGYRLGSKILKKIAQSDFPLERLTIDSIWTGKESEVINSVCKILQTFKDTLKYFKISCLLNSYLEVVNDTRYRNNKRWPTNFRMEKLTEFRMVNGLPLGFNVLTQIDMPNLETLILEYHDHLSGMGEHRLEVAFPKQKVFEKLEVLEIFDHGAILKPRVIQDMGKGMPNLVKLTVPVNREGFRAVCEHFRNLKSLKIIPRQCQYEFDLDEETLTGISKRGNMGGSTQPNITDLTSLRDLSICCEAQLKRNDVKFGDHSVIHGFLKLPRLHSLSIAFKALSKNVKAKLLKHVHGNVQFQTKPVQSK